METMFVTKEFFEKTIKSKNLEARDDNTYINTEERANYLFNSQINGIEGNRFYSIDWSKSKTWSDNVKCKN